MKDVYKRQTRVDRMRRKLKTKAGKAVYAARKAIVEPVFGQIKHARGFRQFLLRGIDKVRGEWSLVCLTHNILDVYKRQAHMFPPLSAASAIIWRSLSPWSRVRFWNTGSPLPGSKRLIPTCVPIQMAPSGPSASAITSPAGDPSLIV